MIARRLFLVLGLSLGLGLTLAACAGGTPRDADGRPLEALSVVTSSGEHRFMVEIADDDVERQRGLMEREPLADDRGMLFEFQDVRERGFWMHNTPSPLDIIYIAPDGRVVSLVKNAEPMNDRTYPSGAPAAGVLELRGGRGDEIGLAVGDLVKHPFFGNAD